MRPAPDPLAGRAVRRRTKTTERIVTRAQLPASLRDGLLRIPPSLCRQIAYDLMELMLQVVFGKSVASSPASRNHRCVEAFV